MDCSFVAILFSLILNRCAFAEICNKTNLNNTCMEWTEFSFILKPSHIDGIGVFATHDIAVGKLLVNKGHNTRILKIKDVPLEFIRYCVYINAEECVCPERFDRMEIGWFINHSENPNIAFNESVLSNFDIKSGSVPAYSFYALKDIKAGDEIVMNYNSLKEPAALKGDFYKNLQS